MPTWEEQKSAYDASHRAGSTLTYEQWLSRYISGSGPEAPWPTTPAQPVKVRYKYPPPPLLTANGILSNATLNLDLTNPATAAQLTTVRASAAWADNLAGVWTSFANNIPRITDRGLLVEEARTNVVLWNRDLTNAAWVKTSATAAKDQIGIDGIANSASSLTATAGNATVLQTITLASAARWQSAWVKRITGSGVVQMTMDNGAAWTAVTVTAAWTRVAIPTQTLANPIVGFRIVTSGDAIAVDFVQNENGVFGTSPIAVTTVAVARVADSVLITTPPSPLSGALSVYTEQVWTPKDGASNSVASLVNDGSLTNYTQNYIIGTTSKTAAITLSGGATQLTSSPGIALTTGQIAKIATAYALNDGQIAGNGTISALDTAVTLPVGLNAIRLGGISTINSVLDSYLRRVAIWAGTRLSTAQLATLTA